MSDERKQLGKIRNVTFGRCGYQEAMFGYAFTLGGDGWGVGDSFGYWNSEIKPSASAEWKESDRTQQKIEVMDRIESIMNDAKVESIQELVGKPVEVTFHNFNHLKSWRILKEVI